MQDVYGSSQVQEQVAALGTLCTMTERTGAKYCLTRSGWGLPRLFMIHPPDPLLSAASADIGNVCRGQAW